MKELNLLYKDLIKLKDQQLKAEAREHKEQFRQQIIRDVSKPSFWIGLGFIVVSLMLVINFLLV